MSAKLPSFAVDPLSPPLAGEGTALALAIESTGPKARVVHGTYRVTTADRKLLGRAPVRHQIWLLLIDRASLGRRAGRPGAGTVVFEADEPAGGPVAGYFSVDLHECVGLEVRAAGTYDLIAVLGPFKSPSVELPIGV